MLAVYFFICHLFLPPAWQKSFELSNTKNIKPLKLWALLITYHFRNITKQKKKIKESHHMAGTICVFPLVPFLFPPIVSNDIFTYSLPLRCTRTFWKCVLKIATFLREINFFVFFFRDRTLFFFWQQCKQST